MPFTPDRLALDVDRAAAISLLAECALNLAAPGSALAERIGKLCDHADDAQDAALDQHIADTGRAWQATAAHLRLKAALAEFLSETNLHRWQASVGEDAR